MPTLLNNDFEIAGDPENAPLPSLLEGPRMSQDFFERIPPMVEFPGDPGPPGAPGVAPLRLLAPEPTLSDEEAELGDEPGGDNAELTQIAKEARVRSLLQQESTARYKTAVQRANPVLGSYQTADSFMFDDFRGGNARMAADLYRAEDPDALHIRPDYQTASMFPDSGEPRNALRTVVNFLASDEMGLLGMKWDEDGFTWAKDNFIQQVTEHPYASAFTVAADLLAPVTFGWSKSVMVARRAKQLAELGGVTQQGIKYTFKNALKDSIKPSMFGESFETLAKLDVDDHAALVKNIAFGTEGRRMFGDEMITKLRTANADGVKKLISRKDLNRMLVSDYWDARHLELASKAASGAPMSLNEKFSHTMGNIFRNEYTKGLQDPERATIEKMDRWYERMGFGHMLAQIPTGLGRESQETWYKWMAGTVDRDTVSRAIGEHNMPWAESFKAKLGDLFRQQADEGFLDDDTIRLFNDELGIGYHLPAVNIDTPDFTNLGILGERVSAATKGGGLKITGERGKNIASIFTGPTTLRRQERRTMEGLMGQLDKLEVDPRKLTIGGYIKDNLIFKLHQQFRELLIEGGIKKNPKLADYVKSIDQIRPNEMKYWYNLTDLDRVVPGLSSRMRRMVDKEAAKLGLDPAAAHNLAIDRHVIEDMFGKGESSGFATSNFIYKFMELMTAVNKTASTALNPTTQASNIVGNMALQMMGGMNPWSKTALNDGKVLTGMYVKMAKHLGTLGKDARFENLMTVDIMGRHLDDVGARYIKGVDGSNIDLAEFFADPKMVRLLEAQSFESVEGLNYVNRVLDKIDSADTDKFGDKALKSIAGAIAGVGETRGIKQTLSAMSSTYLAGDMIPKMQFAMHLRRKGWGVDAIVREVGRRMPQYATVGKLPASGRRVVLPWITFPAEMTRIMKNNMMDSPIQTALWLQAPQMIQGLVSGIGLGPEFEDKERIFSWAQPFAHKYQSVILNESTAPETLGAVGGATAGGIAGGVLGGAVGAAAGAVGGATLGMGIGHLGQTQKDESQQFYRSWMVDALPQSGLFPASLSPLEWAKLGKEGGGVEAFKTAKNLSPVEPFAMLMPLLDVWTQRGAFGQEIPTTGIGQSFNKMALGLLGFVSPPLIQKYGMKLEGPSGNPIAMADIFEANGGQATLPKALTATFWGLSMGSLAYAGAGKLPIPLSGGARIAAGLGMGALATSAGMEMNSRRLMQDLGIFGEPHTGKYGEWTMDFLMNSFFGTAKSWSLNPAQSQFNQTMRSNRFEEMRSVLNRDFRDGAENGMESKMISAASGIRQSFLFEYGNTEIADRKFIEWQEMRFKELMKNPAFAGLSEEQMLIRFGALREANDTKSKAYNQEMNAVQAALLQKRAQKTRNTKLVRE